VSKLVELVDIVTNFYTYEGTVKALNRVSLTIEHGSSFGLVGESGCGKSVTARSIMRVVQEPGRIEGGSVLVYLDETDETKMIDLMKQSEDYMVDLRGNKISMIFQEPNAALNPIMSVGEQVAESFLFHRKQELCKKVLSELNSPDCKTIYPLRKLLQSIYRAADENPDSFGLKLMSKIPVLKWWRRRMKQEALKQSAEIIAKLGIPNPAEVVKLYPHNLSGGMKQRIVIAIALACNPVLLIADEATSNLDVTIQAQILELLRELKQKEISSILLITHDLGVVAETCDRVGVMYAGNLCEVADVKDLFSHPRHPYTRALLDSVPKLSQEGELKSIEGNVPNLVTPPPGCRFHPRCPYRKGICSVELPELRNVGKNHQAACHVLPE
jgi:peptide/nickel transport system ATP-binding protein